jgi:hypothetical protein
MAQLISKIVTYYNPRASCSSMPCNNHEFTPRFCSCSIRKLTRAHSSNTRAGPPVSFANNDIHWRYGQPSIQAPASSALTAE